MLCCLILITAFGLFLVPPCLLFLLVGVENLGLSQPPSKIGFLKLPEEETTETFLHSFNLGPTEQGSSQCIGSIVGMDIGVGTDVWTLGDRQVCFLL